jgi:hypothetical protein
MKTAPRRDAYLRHGILVIAKIGLPENTWRTKGKVHEEQEITRSILAHGG